MELAARESESRETERLAPDELRRLGIDVGVEVVAAETSFVTNGTAPDDEGGIQEVAKGFRPGILFRVLTEQRFKCSTPMKTKFRSYEVLHSSN